MKTCSQCGATFKTWVWIDGRQKNLCHRSRCLRCHPFKSPYVRRVGEGPFVKCMLCGKDMKSTRRLCGACTTKVRRYRAKKAAISFLGGKCISCGWSGPQSGFSFHHRNQSSKEFDFGRVWNKSWTFLKRELGKCDLLCLICHVLKHSSRENKALQRIADQYKGRELVW